MSTMDEATANGTAKIYHSPRGTGASRLVWMERITLDPDTDTERGAVAAQLAHAEPAPAGHQISVKVYRDADPDAYTIVSGPWTPSTPARLPHFTPVRVDQVQPGAVVLGRIDDETGAIMAVSAAVRPATGEPRALIARHAAPHGFRLVFTDRFEIEYPGSARLAVMTPPPRIISGPHPPVPTVPSCDIGGEDLPRDHLWWIVARTDPADESDRHAACATHTGVDPLPFIAPAPRSRYRDAIAACAETFTAVSGSPCASAQSTLESPGGAK